LVCAIAEVVVELAGEVVGVVEDVPFAAPSFEEFVVPGVGGAMTEGLVVDCADSVSEIFAVALLIAKGLAADCGDGVSERFTVALGTTDDMIYGGNKGGPARDRNTAWKCGKLSKAPGLNEVD